MKSVKSVIRDFFPFPLRAYAFCGGWEGCVQGAEEERRKRGWKTTDFTDFTDQSGCY